MADARTLLQQLIDAAFDEGRLSEDEYNACEAYLNGDETPQEDDDAVR